MRLPVLFPRSPVVRRLWALLLCAALSACSRQAKPVAAKGAAPVPVVVAPVQRRAIPLYVDAIGLVESMHSIAIRSQVTGVLFKVDFVEGQEVKKGDLLFEIDPRPFQNAVALAEADVEKYSAQLETAQDQLKRYSSLLPQGMVSQEQYKTIENAQRSLKAQLLSSQAALANARLQLEYCSIHAPIDGRTGSLGAHEGDLVRANDANTLVAITQLTPVYVTFSVPQQNLPIIQQYLTKGEIPTTADPEGRKELGKLTFVDSAVDASTLTVRLKGTFPNADRALWPGQYVDIRATLAVEADQIVVPAPAVQAGQGGAQVFVVRDNQTAELRKVVAGRNVGDETIILSGLQGSERVVVDGQIRLRPDSPVEIKEPVRDSRSLRRSGQPADSTNFGDNKLPDKKPAKS